MTYAKFIFIWAFAVILSAIWSVNAYKYFTTTTIEDVSKKVEAYEKAKSDMVQAKLEYCYDNRLDSKKCEEVIIGTGSIWTHSTGNTVPPSKTVEEAKEKFAHAKLYQDVCKKQINSPLCKDEALFDRLYQLTEERLPWKNFYPILLGITNAESSLGLNFAKDKVWGTCAGRNNWGWAKYMIKDDNTRIYSRSLNWFFYWEEYYWRFIDQYWCNLFPFESIEEFWISKVNWMRFWYQWCIDSKTPIKCLSYKYVWDRNVAEQSWISNVSIFLWNDN